MYRYTKKKKKKIETLTESFTVTRSFIYVEIDRRYISR